MSRTPRILYFAVLLLTAFSISPAFSVEDEAVNVGCYAGTREQYVTVGNLDVSNPSKKAVGLCNAIYQDCYHQCWACWTDDDGYDVCRDVSDRQFSR